LVKEENSIILLVVADGMGGHNAGEIASDVAKKTIDEYIFLNDLTDASSTLEKAVVLANKNVFEKSETEAGYVGMGTTVTCALIYENFAYIANVGDGRTYLLRDNKLMQVTKDHSYVQRLVDAGFITMDEARFHPRSNVITRAIGTNENVAVDLFKNELNKGDVYLLCSDGLTTHVDDEYIEKTLKADIKPPAKVKKLISHALEQGGSDNITAVIAEHIDG